MKPLNTAVPMLESKDEQQKPEKLDLQPSSWSRAFDLINEWRAQLGLTGGTEKAEKTAEQPNENPSPAKQSKPESPTNTPKPSEDGKTEAVRTEVRTETNQPAMHTDGATKELTNRWIPRIGTDKFDKLTLRASYTVDLKQFRKDNPDAPANLDEIRASQRFSLTHPTTGEVDGDWKIAGRESNQLRLEREYSFRVQQGKHEGLVERMPGVPAEFGDKLERKLRELPQNVLDNLRDSGYKIIATPTIVDAMPRLRGLTPRGWSKDLSFDDSDGTHDNVSRRIIAPMRVKSGDQWEPVSRDEVVVHQIGHALDFANNFLSSRKDFVDAFSADMARANDPENHIIKYFSQPDGPGRQEAFAALFGLVLTGPENESDKTYLEEKFPRTIKVVQQQIKELGARKR